jgi:alcohol dehydrogenase (cytochrome c)
MNHRTYDAQRYSPLDKINKGNVKSLKLAYAVAIGGTSINENLQSNPLAEDGYLYVVDQWGVLYKIDGRSGDIGRIVWRMDPGQEKVPLSNRGAALWGNLVVSVASYPARVIATNKETGKVVWETNLADGQADLQLAAAPLAVKDKLIIGAAGGDRGVRDFIAALDGATEPHRSHVGRPFQLSRADRIRNRRRRSVYRRSQEPGALTLSELQRRADDSRRPRVHGLGRRLVHRL